MFVLFGGIGGAAWSEVPVCDGREFCAAVDGVDRGVWRASGRTQGDWETAWRAAAH